MMVNMYEEAKREVKKAVLEANDKVYEDQASSLSRRALVL